MPSNELNSPLLNYEQLLMTENIKNEERNFYMGPVIFMDKQLKRLREAPVHVKFLGILKNSLSLYRLNRQ